MESKKICTPGAMHGRWWSLCGSPHGGFGSTVRFDCTPCVRYCLDVALEGICGTQHCRSVCKSYTTSLTFGSSGIIATTAPVSEKTHNCELLRVQELMGDDDNNTASSGGGAEVGIHHMSSCSQQCRHGPTPDYVACGVVLHLCELEGGTGLMLYAVKTIAVQL